MHLSFLSCPTFIRLRPLLVSLQLVRIFGLVRQQDLFSALFAVRKELLKEWYRVRHALILLFVMLSIRFLQSHKFPEHDAHFAHTRNPPHTHTRPRPHRATGNTQSTINATQF
uniref:Putative secreted protein n=1 Tax=Anopheles triannulatus TaxID=58253 RepID=A0A2M4B489_9DIPT